MYSYWFGSVRRTATATRAPWPFETACALTQPQQFESRFRRRRLYLIAEQLGCGREQMGRAQSWSRPCLEYRVANPI